MGAGVNLANSPTVSRMHEAPGAHGDTRSLLLTGEPAAAGSPDQTAGPAGEAGGAVTVPAAGASVRPAPSWAKSTPVRSLATVRVCDRISATERVREEAPSVETIVIPSTEASGVAISEAASRGCDVVQFTPNQVKDSVAGWGAAPKEQVQRMVQQRLGLASLPKPADAADAAALASWADDLAADAR